MIEILKLKLKINDDNLIKKISHKYKVKENDIKEIIILKKSLDARSEEFYYVYDLALRLNKRLEQKLLKRKEIIPYVKKKLLIKKIKKLKTVNIIGNGPSGIFAAYALIRAGFKVRIFEQGSHINKENSSRIKDLDIFIKEKSFNKYSNMQFGAGGAGSFSDAKLTSRSKDYKNRFILEIFNYFGASENILYDNLPHIGTDKIREIVSKINDDLSNRGCELYFNTKVDDIIIDDKVTKGVIAGDKFYEADYNILAIGHSAYDLAFKLKEKGIKIIAKEFAVGFRCEHPRSLIDKTQNKKYHQILNSASYSLSFKCDDKHSIYSFCMCPGGYVMPASASANTICLNGMSYASRNNDYSNAGILIPIRMDEFYKGDCFDGIKYINDLEEKAFNISKDYKIPAQNIKDYLNNELNPLIFKPSYPMGVVNYNLTNFFNEKQSEMFKKAFIDFDKKIPGFINEGIIMAVESRSSCPYRILRNNKYEALDFSGLYPIGEGAGYAGGIMSSALDGLNCALNLIEENT